jgi:hypothetical protein
MIKPLTRALVAVHKWRIERENVLIELLNLGFFILIVALAHYINVGNLFISIDGTYMLTLLANQSIWNPPAFGFYWTNLQGLWSLQFPLNAFWLPAYFIPYALFGITDFAGAQFQAFAYSWFAVELFVATLVLGVALRFDRFHRVVAAWLVPFLYLPTLSAPLVYPISSIAPNAATGVAQTALLMALFSWQGRLDARIWADLTRFILGCILVAHMIVAQPILFLLTGVVLPVAMVGLTWQAASRRELVIKIASAAALAVLLAFTGFAGFVVGIFVDTASGFWASEFEQVHTTLYGLSMLFQGSAHGWTGPMLFATSAVGLAQCALSRGDPRSRFATTVLLFIVLLIGFGLFTLAAPNFWKGPLPVYFELFLLPIYALFAIHSVKVSGAGIGRMFSRVLFMRSGTVFRTLGITAAIAWWGFAAYLTPPSNRREYPFPPARNAFLEKVIELARLSPGANFHGRVATIIAGQEQQGSVGWHQQALLDYYRTRAIGNDFRTAGLWYYNVPTLFEYSQTMSPAFYRAVTYLLARGQDKQMRNVVVLQRIEPFALALLGVRYVLTDALQSEPLRLVATDRTFPGEMVYLYEVPGANLGLSGVLDVMRVSSFEDALKMIADRAFDPKRTALVIEQASEEAIPSPLTRVLEVSLRVVPGGMTVSARSEGAALLILPVEFSRCLTATSHLPETPRLTRVNALETGLIFSHRVDVTIQYFTGPFQNAYCRLRDAREFRKMLKGS